MKLQAQQKQLAALLTAKDRIAAVIYQ